MPAAARITDPTAHPGAVAPPGVLTVLIDGLPAATVATAVNGCMFPGVPPHPPNPFLRGSTTVSIAGSPALRMGDVSGCGAAITSGSPDVVIGG